MRAGEYRSLLRAVGAKRSATLRHLDPRHVASVTRYFATLQAYGKLMKDIGYGVEKTEDVARAARSVGLETPVTKD